MCSFNLMRSNLTNNLHTDISLLSQPHPLPSSEFWIHCEANRRVLTFSLSFQWEGFSWCLLSNLIKPNLPLTSQLLHPYPIPSLPPPSVSFGLFSSGFRLKYLTHSLHSLSTELAALSQLSNGIICHLGTQIT